MDAVVSVPIYHLERQPVTLQKFAFSVLLAGLLWCFLLLNSVRARAETTFSFENGAIQVTVLSSTEPVGHFSFYVFGQPGKITSASAKILSVKNAGGALLPPEAATAKLDSTVVKPEGTTISVTYKPSLFAQAGTYRANVLLTGKAGGKPVIGHTTIQMVRQALEINTDPLKDRSLPLIRPCPGWKAGGKFHFDLPITSLDADLAAVNVRGGPVLLAGTQTVIGGSRVDVKPAQSSARPGVLPLDVIIDGVNQAGTFDTELIVSYPGSPDKTIPAKLLVTDAWPTPLLAIACGVLLAWIARRIVEQNLPHLRNQYLLTQLQADYDEWDKKIQAADEREKLAGIETSLRMARQQVAQKQETEAAKSLSQASADLNALRISQTRKAAEVEVQCSMIDSALKSFQLALAPGDALISRIDAALIDLKGVKTLLDQGRADQSKLQLEGIQKNFTEIQQEHYRASLVQAEQELNRRVSDAEARKPVLDLISAVRDLIAAGTLDQVPGKIADIQDRIQSLGAQRLAVRPPEEEEIVSPFAAAAPAPARLTTTIVVPIPTETRLQQVETEIERNEWILTATALLIAVVTGFSVLYVGKTFGTMQDYIAAFFWGLGVNETLRGFQAIYQKIRAPE